MIFQIEITPIAEKQIERSYTWYRARNPEFADRWFRGLMNTIATLQENPQRCGLAIEHEIFSEEVRQLLYGKAKNVYRILFVVRGRIVYVLYIRHRAQAPLGLGEIEVWEDDV